MFLTKKNILLISPERWDHLFVSKHHYAIQLAKLGNHVFFLNPPSNKYAIVATEFERLHQVKYTPFIKGLRFMPSSIQRWFLKQKFKKIQHHTQCTFDIVWSFDNSVFFDFSFLPEHVLKISHIVDYSQNFQFSKAASTANVCFGVSQNIVDRLKKNNPRSFLISHGYSHLFHQSKSIFLPGKNKIKAMYAGNLSSRYLDTNLFTDLISRNQSVDFIFIGECSKPWINTANTFFIGKVERAILMNYLEKADILLLLYDHEKHPDQLTNAHKILEYLATGKVIVSNFFLDYDLYPELLRMYNRKDEVFMIFNETIQSLEKWNRAEAIQHRKNHALSNTYLSKINEIEDHIKLSGLTLE